MIEYRRDDRFVKLLDDTIRAAAARVVRRVLHVVRVRITRERTKGRAARRKRHLAAARR